MAFWGKIIMPTEPFTLRSDASSTRRRLRLTQASLEDETRSLRNCSAKSVVSCTVGNQNPIILCTLTPSTGYRCTIRLEFEETEHVVFSVTGFRSVHLAGYFMRPSTTTTDSSKTHNECEQADIDKGNCGNNNIEKADIEITMRDQADIDKTMRNHCTNNISEQADIQKTSRDHCSNNDSGQYEHDPFHSFIADSSIPESLPLIRARVEEFDNDKTIGGKQVGEEFVSNSYASQPQFICTEKKTQVENNELLVGNPQIEELLEMDSIKNDVKEPQKFDVVILDENTKGINVAVAATTENKEIQPDTIEISNGIAAMTENDEIQPDTTEINVAIAATTENKEIQPDTIEISNGIAAMTENDEIQPDTTEINNVIASVIEEISPDTIEINNVIAATTENEEIQPDTIEIDNVIVATTENEDIQPDTIENTIAARTENEEIQPDTIENYNFNAAMTESEEIVPDSDDNSDNDNDVGNARSGYHVKLQKQESKKSIVEHGKVIVESIETNMKEASNMNTFGCTQKETFPDDSEIMHIEGGEVCTRIHSRSKKKKGNKDNMLDKEISQNINKESKKIEGVDENIIAGSAESEGKSRRTSNRKVDKGDDVLYLKGAKDVDVEEGKTKGGGVMISNHSCKSGGCPNEDGTRKLNGGTDDEGNGSGINKLGFCNIENQTQKEMLANDKTSIIHDQDHDSVVPSTVVNAGVSVKLKKKKRKGSLKESKMVVENIREEQNQIVDERNNNNICVKDENARKVADLPVLKESKKIKKLKVKACKIGINTDSNSQDNVLAPTPSSDLKSKLHQEKQVADSFVKENGKQKKRRLKTSKSYDKSTETKTITILALQANLENSKPIADSSTFKEKKRKSKKRKLETSQIPETHND